MPNKQVKMQFLVNADNNATCGLTIKVDGVVKYTGTVSQNKNELDPSSVTFIDATDNIEFDVDVPAFERGTGKISTLAHQLATLTHAQVEIEISVDGGSVICRNISANYSPVPRIISENDRVPSWESSGTEHVDCSIVSQPMRSGVAALDKFDGTQYFGAHTVTRPSGEEVTADLPTPYFTITNEAISANYSIPRYM
jgi:hypothetical protein